MKIAYVYDAVYPYQIGGVEKRIFEMGRRLAARGHEIHIYGLRTWSGDPSFYRDGMWYHGVGQKRPFYHKGRRSVSEAVYFGYNVLKPLLLERFDIIDCQNFPYFSCISSNIASRIRHIPLVITWHEVWGGYWCEYLGLKGFFGEIVEKFTSKLSDNLIAVSELTRNDLVRLNPLASIEIIPNGIDIQQISSVKPDEISSDIIFTGRLVREKRLDLLIDALVHIKKEIPDVQCVVIGDGPEKDKLLKLSGKNRLDKNLRFVGFVQNQEQVIALMKSSKLYASPSYREGFGMAALEALACGLPIVTCDSPKNAVKELINEKTGIICLPSPEAFAESVIACLKRNNSMKEDCTRMAGSYDWNLIAERMVTYYSGTIG
jgi:L-malate glycosyltransferase